MESKFWSSTAIFVTWDDYGGWYDHVPPPQVDAYGFGFRVPCLIISPYAKEGFIDHTQAEFASILKFIETVHGLPALTKRDAMASDLFEAFDFSQPPRAPLILPGPYVPDHYPLTVSESATQAKELLVKATDLRRQVMISNFSSWEAQGTVKLAMREYDSAERAYAQYDFSAAKEHAQTAVYLFEKAYTAERNSAILNYILVAIGIVAVGSVIAYLARRRRRTRKPT
jgi:hypothetical protein